MTKTNYRTKDFTPIYAWSRSNHLLVVHTDTWKSLDEFVKAGRTKTLSGGLPGRGTPSQLAGLETVDKLGIKVNWVPYDGAVGSLAALAGKHLDFTICIPSTATGLIDAGKIRPLVLFSEEKDPFFPEVPLSRDLGFDITPVPGIRGASAPPRTPAPIIKVLEEAVSKAVKEPGFVEWAKRRKVVLHPLTSREYNSLVETTYQKAVKFQQMLAEN
jgi:tripartite-type tricarboxylate transporter receptor subunit TctC